MAPYKYVVLSNSTPGDDEEFNDWYTNVHIVDTLKIPGMLSAQRYRLTDVQRRDPPYRYKYLSLYEIDPARAEQVVAALRAQSGTERMPVSATFDTDHIALVFEAICEMKTPASEGFE